MINKNNGHFVESRDIFTVRKKTKVKLGSLVKLIDGMSHDPMYQTSLWDEDLYFLRDPISFKITNVWIKHGEISIVIAQDPSGILIVTPRNHLGWINKEKMEIIK